jgi:hypothetical protein
MKVLVIGKAKTGTTALASLIKQTIGTDHLYVEPKLVGDFSDDLSNYNAGVVKIIFEHFFENLEHLSGIINGEFNVKFDKVIFIRRDIRDEMISRLFYLSKAFRSENTSEENWRKWISLIEEKEENNSKIPFIELCHRFSDIFSADAWEMTVNGSIRSSVGFIEFCRYSVKREHIFIEYEELICNKNDKISKYIGIPVAVDLDDVDLGELEYTNRSGNSGNWRRFFTEEDVRVLRPIIAEHLGDFEEWDLSQDRWLDPSHGSIYVRRMAGICD